MLVVIVIIGKNS